MRRLARSAFGMALVALLLGTACGNALPGNMLGTYSVVAQSLTNTCGLAAPNPWSFDVQLSQDGTLLYWSWMDGSAPLSSPLSTSTATLLATEQLNVDGTPDGGLGPCSMERDDTVVTTLGTGSPPSTFTGSISYAISATAGSDCSDQLVTTGGLYDVLPCTLTYSMTATRQ